ncbi:hypothetical protein D3C74_477500 [compost metagenome]
MQVVVPEETSVVVPDDVFSTPFTVLVPSRREPDVLMRAMVPHVAVELKLMLVAFVGAVG